MAHPDATTGGEAGGATATDAVSRFSAFLDEKPEDTPADAAPIEDAPATDEIQADDASPDAEAADETTEQATDEPQTAAIDPPVSWKADMKGRFAELPDDVKAYIAEREGQVDKALRTAAEQGNAKSRSEIAQRDRAIAQLQQTYANQLQQFLGSTEPQRPDPAWLDTSQYGEEGPRAFYQQQAIYEAHHAQRQAAQQELHTVQQQMAEQEAQARAAYDAEQHRILSEAIPEWGNPEARAALAKDIAATAEALGYDAARLNDVDATDVLALNKVREIKAKADKWDALQKQKMETVRAAKNLPPVNKPGTPSPRGSVQAERTAQQRDQLKRTGHYRDAAKLFEQFV